ncbi:MAG: methyltransferase domain-containing protein [Verrucomicrobia bacterium]|jgi:predicted nicotinamide N-methyase|nr:methyltransferase domain-containing protein [Verrucomicrobiota bacterium]
MPSSIAGNTMTMPRTMCPIWPTHTIMRQFGAFQLQLNVIKDFDTVLNHCVEHHPNDTDMIPYYADLWPSAEALGQHLVSTYSSLSNMRVIELGCGLGLPSILCAKLGAEVTATDFHPDNAPYFTRNAAANNVPDITYRQMDWAIPDFPRQFDMVIGSDLLYEPKQIVSLTRCVLSLLAPRGTFILADPGRDHIQAAVDALTRKGFDHDINVTDSCFIVSFTAPPHSSPPE